jgi:hypothetical protein
MAIRPPDGTRIEWAKISSGEWQWPDQDEIDFGAYGKVAAARAKRVAQTGASSFGDAAPGESAVDERIRLIAALKARNDAMVREGKIVPDDIVAALKSGADIDTIRAVVNSEKLGIVAGRVTESGQTSIDPLVSETSFTGAETEVPKRAAVASEPSVSPPSDFATAIEKLIAQMQRESQERAKIEANRDTIQASLNDARVRISGLEAGTNVLEQFASNPASMMTSMFVDPANAGQLVPVTPGMSSLLRREGLQPTALGARANAPLEGITPGQITPDLFRDIIHGMTNRDVNRAENNPGVMSRIIAMGQLANLNAPAAFQARAAQTPTQSSIEGSLFKTGLI